MYVTTESGETHSYKSVIFCNDYYYCYDREFDEIEEISEGKYHVIN